ncbi:hypothetical protein Tco_0167052, partial [Tanacetum coccineum]
DDRERDEITEAALLSLALYKTAKIAEEQKNVAEVEKHKLVEEVEKIIECDDEESYASEFADSAFLNDDDDSGNRIEPGNHKENPEMVDDDDKNGKEKKDDKKDDDDNDDHTGHTLIKTQVTGSLKTRKEKIQTPIPSPHRSSRTDLSSDKTVSQELTTSVSPTPDTTSQDHLKPTSINTKVLPGSIAEISRRCGKIRKPLNTTSVTNAYF